MMPPRLSEVARQIPGAQLLGPADPQIQNLTADSRAVQPGSLFAAIRGFKIDGNQYLNAALSAGATAVISQDEEALRKLPGGVGRLLVPDDRLALAIAADAFYGHPSGELILVGVTGTNGKTTTVTLAAAMLEAAGFPSATLGTLGLSVRGSVTPGDRTTPEAPEIQGTLRSLAADGIKAVAMEVSSHALDLRRTWGCAFDAAVFTNLTQDHLDYHPSMEEYFEAKARLFLEYPAAGRKPFTAVVNNDDPYGRRLAQRVTTPLITFGLDCGAGLRAAEPEVTPHSVAFTACFDGQRFPVRVNVGAHFNVYNTLGAVGVGLALGISPEQITTGLAAAQPVGGRFESVECGQPFTVIVDYAHTPDGLLNVLRSARQITGGKLWAVFGCGGDRDPGKRPQMGRIAADLADRIVVTSDNPRTEKPEAIIAQILAGMPGDARGKVVAAVEDRREGIRTALQGAREGDVVVVAGKGHETYQIFADRTIAFDDREVVRELVRGMGA